MTDAVVVRQALAEFLGEGTFRKWVIAYNQHHRLRFWQEKEWRRFTTTCPQVQISDDDLEAVFRICHVHGDELQLGVAKVFHGYRDFSREYEKAWGTLFPYATDDISTEGRLIAGNEVDMYYCPTCRLAKRQYLERSQR